MSAPLLIFDDTGRRGGGGAAATFAAIPGLWYWQPSTGSCTKTGGGACADGDGCAAITPLYGSGSGAPTLTQATGGTQLTFRTSGGQSWLETNGTKDMEAAVSLNTSYTVFAAVRPSGPLSFGMVVVLKESVEELRLDQAGNNIPAIVTVNGYAWSSGGASLSSGADGVMLGTSDGAAGTSAVYLDNTLSATNSATPTVPAIDRIKIGTRGGSNGFAGRYYGFGFVPRVVAAGERALIQAAMADLF